MKKYFTLTLLAFSFFAFAQNDLKDAPKNKALYLLDGVIASYDFAQKIDPANIEAISVYKSGSNPSNLDDFVNHLGFGIIEIRMKKYQEQFIRVPLHALNAMYHLDYNTPVYIDGFLVKNNKAEIYQGAIGEIVVTNNDSSKVLNIITADKATKKGSRVPPATIQQKENKRPEYIKQIK